MSDQGIVNFYLFTEVNHKHFANLITIGPTTTCKSNCVVGIVDTTGKCCRKCVLKVYEFSTDQG